MLDNVYLVTYGKNLDIRGTKYDSLPLINMEETPDYEFEPGNRYLVMWNDNWNSDKSHQPYYLITDRIHLGPRRENHYDLTYMDYVLTRSGIIFKFMYCRYEYTGDWIDKDRYEMMLPNIDKIATRIRGANVRKIWSERKQKDYYRFEFEVVREPSGDIERFLNDPDYIKDYPKMSYYKIIRDTEDMNNAFQYFMDHDQMYGFDYETNSFPFDDPEFFTMGLGIAGEDGIAAYFDLEWMQTLGGNFEIFKDWLRKFCDKYEKKIITYNVGFEMRVTYLILHKLYTFNDAATVNKIEGLVTKRYTLKFTAMKELHTSSWDDDFEFLNKILPDLFGWSDDTESYAWSYNHEFISVTEDEDSVLDEEGNLLPDGQTRKVTVTKQKDIYYKNNPVWNKIMEMYPEEEAEFDRLFALYWGYPFKCIPSNLLGKYCCWDAFNTVQLKASCLTKYTEKAWNYLNDNLVLGALLDINGQFIDEKELNYQELVGYHLVAYGQLVSVIWKLHYDLSVIGIYDDINVPELVPILRAGIDPFDMKSVLISVMDENCKYGIDDNKLSKWFSQDFIDIIHSYIDYYYEGKLLDKHLRARKIFNELNEEMCIRFNPKFEDNKCTFTYKPTGESYTINASWDIVKSSFKKLADMQYYEHLLNQFKLNEPIHSVIDLTGREVTTREILDMCTATYNINSNLEDPYFKFAVYNYFKPTIYKCLISMTKYEDDGVYDKDQYCIDGDIEFSDSDITEEDLKYMEDHEVEIFMAEKYCNEVLEKYYDKIDKTTESWKWYEKTGDVFSLLWDQLSLDLFLRDTGKLDDNGNPIMEKTEDYTAVYQNLDSVRNYGFRSMLRYLATYPLDYDEGLDKLYKHQEDIDIKKKSIFALGKLGWGWFSTKKYGKIMSTYIDGQFSQYNCVANDYDDNWVSTERWHDWDELHKVPGLNLRSYSPFNVAEKQSKRWSAGSHTIPSKSQVKRNWTCPKGALTSYFDISGAEVRAISYLAQDKFMMHNYDLGLDPYIEFSKLSDPTLSPKEHKQRRAVFKQLLLGSIYGMGIDLVAEKIGKTPEEAATLHTELFSRLVQIAEMISEKGQYCAEHQGLCESILGDTLEMGYQPDRWERLGINQVIQSFAAVSLAQGFFHCIDVSLHENKIKVRPYNVVHDSCQCYFDTTKLFDMYPYYHHNLTDYLYDLYGVKYEFDLEVGSNYYDMAHLKQIDDDHIKLTGSWRTLKPLFDKCIDEGLKFKFVEFKDNNNDKLLPVEGTTYPEEFKPDFMESYPAMFYSLSGYAVFDIDQTDYSVIIERVK